jgi:hypothetical protein
VKYLTLRDLRADLARGGDYEVNGDPYIEELDRVPCSRCGKLIGGGDPILYEIRNDPVQVDPERSGNWTFKEYEPEPVSHVTVWHVTCEVH